MLKEYRLENNLTQQEMAELLNVNIYTYGRYENHQRKIPYKTLIKFLEIRNKKNDDEVISVLKTI